MELESVPVNEHAEDGLDQQSGAPGLLDRDWRILLILLLTILAAAAVIWVIWLIVRPILQTIVVFLFAAVLAFALAGPVAALSTRLGSRLTAILLTYSLLGLLAVAVVALLSGPFVAQLSALGSDLPVYVERLQSRAPEVEGALRRFGIPASLEDLKANAASSLQAGAVGILGGLAVVVTELGQLFADFLLVLVISFYLVKDGPTFRTRMLAMIPAKHKPMATFIEENLARVLGGYLRGQMVMAGSVGILAGIGCWLLGLPYAVVLGLFAGIFELIPMFGPILSAIPAILVALFIPFPTVLWVALFFLILQQLESNVLAPRITAHAVGLHPVAALFALLAGFQFAGLIGALFAVPVAGFLWVLAIGLYRKAGAERPTAR